MRAKPITAHTPAKAEQIVRKLERQLKRIEKYLKKMKFKGPLIGSEINTARVLMHRAAAEIRNAHQAVNRAAHLIEKGKGILS